MQSDTTCNDCGKVFSTSKNLRRHIQQTQPGKLDVLAPSSRTTNNNHQCKQCDKIFFNSAHLKIHQKRHHPITVTALTCPLCSHKGRSTKDIVRHFQIDHDVTIESEIIEFSSLDQFQSWKNKIEKATRSFFSSGKANDNNCTNLEYFCHRSGIHALRLKTKGPNQIDGFCPANLSVTSEAGKCTVHYIKTHVGHDMDFGLIALTDFEKKQIANEISGQNRFSVTLDLISNSVANSTEPIRLLPMKNMHKIRQQLNLDVVRDAKKIKLDEGKRLNEAWIRDISSDVLLYKGLDSVDQQYPTLTSEDFVLIIMTDYQKSMLKQYANDGIFIDGTRDVISDMVFELTTLLIVNQIQEGFPCVFMVSNRCDKEVFTIFFSQIMKVVGFKIKPKIFMSNVDEQLYNAWLGIMNAAEFRLYCKWHVDNDWRKNLNKINKIEDQVLVYKNLRTLLEETDEAAFSLSMELFLMAILSNENTKEFGFYFQSHYGNRVEKWAYCHWLYNGFNHNMHIERMHQTINHLYKVCVKGLDKAIVPMMKFVRDQYDAYKKKIFGLKSTKERHTSSQNSWHPISVSKTDVGGKVESSSTKERQKSGENNQVVSARTVEVLDKRKTDIDLNVEKERLIASLSETVGRIECVEALDAVKSIAALINPILDVVQDKIGQKPLEVFSPATLAVPALVPIKKM